MQIAIVLYPGFTALDAVGPYEVLHLMPDAEVCFVGHEVGPVLADSGILSITATKSFDEITAPDIVPGELNRHRDRDERPHTPAVAQAGSRHHHMDYLSVHRRLDSRRRRHPARTTGHYTLDDAVALADVGAQSRPDDRIVHAGKVVTAAGVSSGIDFALWLAAEIHGHERARMIQLAIEYDPRPPFDSGHPSKVSAEFLEQTLAQMVPK